MTRRKTTLTISLGTFDTPTGDFLSLGQIVLSGFNTSDADDSDSQSLHVLCRKIQARLEPSPPFQFAFLRLCPERGLPLVAPLSAEG